VRGAVQKLPRRGPEREALREKGQFWTPDWVAEAMVAYVLTDGCEEIFDPAVGAGAFFRAAKALAQERGICVNLRGTEMDPRALAQALGHGLSEADLSRVEVTDFVLAPPNGRFRAIVANPPYIRHHRLPAPMKEELRRFARALIGQQLDGRAGIHIYFLLRALDLLKPEGRLAFIMPADTCEGIFASGLWNWITQRYRLEAVITFSPAASPFPNVDTNAMIFMIRNAPPKRKFFWLRCNEAGSAGLKQAVTSAFEQGSSDGLLIVEREVSEGLTTGFSRECAQVDPQAPVLGHFAKVLRGIATGANDFFFLTSSQAADFGIPDEFLVPAIGRTRDVASEELTYESLEELRSSGRPTLLLSLDDRPRELFPPCVRAYLSKGEELGLPTRPLIAMRRPWYKMEVRRVPPFLFAYLGRRNARFVRNRAGVVPLTGFLCVYPLDDSSVFVEKLWQVLRNPRTVSNLSLVGKSYGAGAIKVEPRALERLPLPSAVVQALGLLPCQKAEQMRFF
jgi:stage V sporulation protein SpoVS